MTTTTLCQVTVRELEKEDLHEADRICRVAFGTFLGVPAPETFFGDAAYVPTRYHAPNTAALAAEIDGELVGSNFATNWGSIGFFGPLSVRVDLWDGGIASALMESTMDLFVEWGTKHATLFTWADSAKHHGLYQKFGFYPTFLTAVMSKLVEGGRHNYSLISEAPDGLDDCRRLADAVYPGLDLSGEIRSVIEQRLGDVVLLHDGDDPVGFAVCHVGGGTEAGSGVCYVKFAGSRPGPAARETFAGLLDATEAFARQRGAGRIVAGMNTGRLEPYRMLLAHGYRTDLTGVAMQQGGEFAYNRPGTFVIDDWR